MDDTPQAGEVFRYPYLWRRQADAGETEGRKRRPACVAAVAARAGSRTFLFILPVTTQPPSPGRIALPIPETEARRAGLDAAADLLARVAARDACFGAELAASAAARLRR
jgi:hypothetical protein